MLVKEFRIPLPLSVSEYRVGQAYMMSKKVKEELGAADGRMELLEKSIRTDGNGIEEIYTKKSYHVVKMIPAWISGLVPQSAVLIEETWNAYPVVRNCITCSHLSKLKIETLTNFLPNIGDDSPFDEDVGTIDEICFELIDPAQNYDNPDVVDEILLFKPKSGRPPLTKDWISIAKSAENPYSHVMCSYKYAKVSFGYFGMQSKTEQFLMDYVKSKVLEAHRQVWMWQDEWGSLSLEEARSLGDQPVVA